jgi:glycosyltransferase involved in cell wall biosynthesis
VDARAATRYSAASAMPSLSVSVAVCTRNRERLLRGTLESLCRLRPPEDSACEVVVVLNDCTDGSAALVDAFSTRLPIAAHVEPQAGLSRARNKAIDVAAGDVIIWIDDDVRVEPDWLRNYAAAFRRWPQASLFGGAITPEFEGGAPRWLQRALPFCETAFATRRVPQPDAPIQADDPPFGANFAVRMPVQRRYRYDVMLGAQPADIFMTGEEIEVIRGILRDGGAGRWVDAAGVRHIMPPERQTVAYIRAYFEGWACLVERRAPAPPGRSPARAFSPEWRDVLGLEWQYRRLRMLAPPERWMPALVTAAVARGRWRGRRRAA